VTGRIRPVDPVNDDLWGSNTRMWLWPATFRNSARPSGGDLILVREAPRTCFRRTRCSARSTCDGVSLSRWQLVMAYRCPWRIVAAQHPRRLLTPHWRAMPGIVGGRPGLRRLLVSYLLPASLRSQARSVAGVTGKTSVQRRRGRSRASAVSHTRSAGSYRTRPACRRSTAFSCRSTSSSASFARSPQNASPARPSTRHDAAPRAIDHPRGRKARGRSLPRRDGARAQRPGEQAPRSGQITPHRQQHVNDLAMLIDRPVQIDPLASDLSRGSHRRTTARPERAGTAGQPRRTPG